MRVAVRAHDITAKTPEELCEKLHSLGVSEIQLVPHKSFPNFVYNKENILTLSKTLSQNGIHVAVYGRYIDPVTDEGIKTFIQHIEYAKILNADVIATESAVKPVEFPCDQRIYDALRESFQMFCSLGQKYHVKVAVETVQIHPVNTVQQTYELLKKVDCSNFGVILDPANLSMENEDLQESYARQAIELYGKSILAVHWKKELVGSQHSVLNWLQNQDAVPLITEGITETSLRHIIPQFTEF